MAAKKSYREKEKELPVLEADVLVAGGGTAGCIAALAAAREGKKTVLVEKNPVLGGTFTNGGNTISSFFNSTDTVEEAVRIVGGIPYEMMMRLEKEGGATGFRPTPNDPHLRPYSNSVNSEMYKGVMAMMLEEAGVKVMTHSFFAGVQTQGRSIEAAFIENKSGRTAVMAKEYVDCSGDGDVAAAAGVHMIENWQNYDCGCSPTGMVFAVGGADLKRTASEGGAAMRATYDAGGNVLKIRFCYVDDARYSKFAEMLDWYWMSLSSMRKEGNVFISYYTGPKVNCSDGDTLSNAELHERIKIVRMVQEFRRTVPGFEECYPIWAATQIGVRASRVADCDKILTEEEIENAARFEDEIGLYGYHDLGARGIEFGDRPEEMQKHPCRRVGKPGYYGFPYRMILPKGIDNLFMAGRCVTADAEAHMSTRNTIGCMVLGQAAGIAAAVCAEKELDSRSLPYSQLRERLLGQGVILEV